MPYLTFLAKHRDSKSFALRGATVMGRSLDCDLFLPDAFVSREHCRFEWTEEGWTVTDLDSTNGIYFNGRRIQKRVLQPDDLIEVGTVAILFEDVREDDRPTTPTPFGEAGSTMELVETICAGDIRPADFARQRRRQPAWKRPKSLLEPSFEIQPLDLAHLEPLPEPEEWTELDVEVQLSSVLADLPDPPAIVPYIPPITSGYSAAGVMADPEADVPSLGDLDALTHPVPISRRDSVDEEEDLQRARQRQIRRPTSAAPKIKFGPTWGDRLQATGRDLASIIRALRNTNVSDLLEQLIAHKVLVAASVILIVALFFGYRWTSERMNRPPDVLSDGRANPAYFNGDEPG